MAVATTPRSTFSKLYAANSTAAAITDPVPTVTPPSGDGVFALGGAGGGGMFNYVLLAFVGAGADNNAGTALVVGWRKCGTLWIPVKLLALAFTLGTTVGVDGATVEDTDRLADTVTASTAFTSAYEIQNPADQSLAIVKVDPSGCDFVQVLGAKGTGTNFNVLAAGF